MKNVTLFLYSSELTPLLCTTILYNIHVFTSYHTDVSSWKDSVFLLNDKVTVATLLSPSIAHKRGSKHDWSLEKTWWVGGCLANSLSSVFKPWRIWFNSTNIHWVISLGQILARDRKINKTKFLSLSLPAETEKMDNSNTMGINGILEVSEMAE